MGNGIVRKTESVDQGAVPLGILAPRGGRSVPRFSLSQTFAALKYRNYRLWFVGQLVSLVGSWMQITAQGYLVFQLTQSPAYLGYVGFAAGIPSLLFMMYGGVVADRLPRRNLMVVTQSTMLVLAFVLAALTFTGLVQPWHIIVLAFLLGVATAFDAPARQAFVLEMVDREDMVNAIALNSTMFNSATAVGPAVAGLTYALLGPAWCFTLNGISFIAVIIALLMMRLKPVVARARTTSPLEDLKEGLRYVASHSIIRTLILLLTVTSVFGLAFATLMPAWAVSILGGDAATNGLLQSARGVGALIGALMIASLGRFHFKGKLLSVGQFVFPIVLLIFAYVRWLPLSLLLLVGVGWGMMIFFNMCNILVQSLVTDQLRGRVMAIYAMSFFGLAPIGSLLAGGVAEHFGAPFTVVLTASIVLGFALMLWIFVPKIRALQ